ncbi:MAG TPA: hypothetical protein DE045_08740 [Oceanospirillaceae bacterium]|nr:hypothetical protein [Oceanospirillaceae bacterium]
MPIGIKDLNAVKGVRSTWGSVGLKDHIPDHSDYFVERLEKRGAIVLWPGPLNRPWVVLLALSTLTHSRLNSAADLLLKTCRGCLWGFGKLLS